MKLPKIMMDHRRKTMTRELMVEYARLNGMALSMTDITQIESKGGGCMKGVERLENYLSLLGYEIIIEKRRD